MGLDMYLTKKTYVKNWDFIKPEEKTSVTVARGGKPYPGINPERISYITEEIGYWRKASAIHAWFVSNVQDGKDECQEAYVNREQLQALLLTCETVLEDHSKAEELLPTQSGFFFGGTEYDEYYFRDIEDTVKIIKSALSEDNAGSSIYYESSW